MTLRSDIGEAGGVERTLDMPPQNASAQVIVGRQGSEMGTENSAASEGSSAVLIMRSQRN